MKTLNITHEIVNLLCHLDVFNCSYEELIAEKKTILYSQARISSISSSVRIEGNQLKDYEIEKVLHGISYTAYREEDVRDARSYARAYDYITKSYKEIVFNENEVLKIHSMILGIDRAKDTYRTTEKIIQNLSKNEPAIENAKAKDAASLTQYLIAKTNNDLLSGLYHPLLVIAAFLLSFLSINPFESGNGRLSRLLTELLLLKSGYSYILYTPLSRIIEESRAKYLTALKRAQSQGEREGWITYFLTVMKQASDKLRLKGGRAQKQRPLSPLEEEILAVITKRSPLYTRELIDELPTYKEPTIKKALIALRNDDIIIMRGSGRGTWYEILA